MFLLHIKKNKILKQDLSKVSHTQNLQSKIKKQVCFFTELQILKQQQIAKFLISKIKTLNFKGLHSIKYIIGISRYNTNAIIYLSDTKGTVKFFCSAGLLRINKKQRKKTITVIAKLVKFMSFKIKSLTKNEVIALHLKNFNRRLSSITLNIILKYYNIELIRVINNQPHNGCRPRKPKRKKKQRLKFHIKKEKGDFDLLDMELGNFIGNSQNRKND